VFFKCILILVSICISVVCLVPFSTFPIRTCYAFSTSLLNVTSFAPFVPPPPT
jgi:hypothetical protein